jgi:hypothetical protein
MRRAFQLMPLQRQIVDVPVGVGLDESTGVFSVQPGRFTKAENCRIVDPNTVEQRPGFAAMGVSYGGGNISLARKIHGLGREIVLDDGEYLYSYSEDTSLWRRVDKIPECMIDQRIPGERGQDCMGSHFDSVFGHGLFVTAWVGSDGYATARTRVRARTTDQATGTRSAISEYTCRADTGVRLLVNATASHAFLFYGRNSGAGAFELVCRKLDLTNAAATWSAETIISTDVLHVDVWDVCIGPDDRIFAAWDDNGDATVHVAEYSTALALVGECPAPVSPQHATLSMSVAYSLDDHRVYVVYFDATNNRIYCDAFNDSGAMMGHVGGCLVEATAANVHSIGTIVHSGGCNIVFSTISAGGAAAPARSGMAIVTTAPILATAATDTFHIVAQGTPYTMGTSTYTLAYMPYSDYLAAPAATGYRTPQFGAVLVEWPQARQGRPVCRIAWSQAYQESGGVAPGLRAVSKYKLVTTVGMLSETRSTTGGVEQNEGFDLYVIDFAAPGPGGTESDGELVLSGGMPVKYDGDRAQELGFNQFPGTLVGVPSNGAGALTPTARYGYSVVYTHRNARGVVTRSAPYSISVLMGGADDTVDLYWPTYGLSTMFDADDASYQVLSEIFRTDDNGLAQYYIATVENDPTSDQGHYQDLGAILDTTTPSLFEYRGLYTNGDVLENVSPPALRQVIKHNGRLWGISADDVDSIWLSKLLSLRESPGWHEGLRVRIPGADITAIASLDGKLVALTKHGLYAVFGSGPSDNDQGNDLSEPQLLAREYGCIDVRSVCTFPLGVAFQSQDGLLYVLGSDMQAKCVSMPVYDTLHLFPIIVSVVYHADSHELRVVCTNTMGLSSTVLVWNTLLDQWHRWKVKNAAGSADPAMVSGAMVSYAGVPQQAVLLSSGVVLRETGSTDADATYPSVSLTTAPIRLSSLQGYQRVWRAGVLFEKTAAVGTTTVTVTGYLNYGTTTAWANTWSAADLTASIVDSRIQILTRVPISQQKCEALALNIAWTPTAQNLRLQGLCFELGAKAGPPRILIAAGRK